ncbi:D-alanine--D-alanine ligase [Conexibacter woesei]|uniref:D-alanine--D-alanine ligase n=1 Tax=Conexibacter woesei (strain DSM 14684 / CCUG 47730 / CIP 108061 / JCM 11494 / NBRC 100937 / ID131577) TaxID=469383 RepID=D3FC35_CONWI|nr:D-alanine--D-alanine ligase [Conexibacter woesei]ADB53330.1 D-alanine--D-alanine ligase [Conexibacter woesei DSM 14684]
MPLPSGQTVGVVFGGPSVEHDVSIITAQQAMAVLSERHTVVPLYIGKDGRWWTGEELRDVSAFTQAPPRGARAVELRLGAADGPFVEPSTSRLRGDRALAISVVLNAIHGTGGEDGALLGALELSGVPHAGRGVAAFAVGMDKHLAKTVLREAGIDVLPHRRIERGEWEHDRAAVLRSVADEVPLPCVVKPATLGSSIGVARCADPAEVEEALELAFELDRQAVVEPFATGATELNCAVLGRPGGELRVSEVERPLGGEAGLTFEDKYLSSGGGKGGTGGGAKGGGAKAAGEGAAGGSKAAGGGGAGGAGGGAKGGDGDRAGGGMAAQGRVIPADIAPELRERVRAEAAKAHRALRVAGVVRYDFFVLPDPDGGAERICVNEPNTVPGSFAFYLFEPEGLAFPDLLDELLAIGLAEAREERLTTRSFASALIDRHASAA